MKILETHGLTKYFGGLCAVNKVDFFIEEGEIFGLIGPNGSGKSVLFNTITGIFRSTEGRTFFNGEDITNLPPYVIAAKGIGRTFQGSKVFLNLTPLQNVMIGRHSRTKCHIGSAIARTRYARTVDKETEEKALHILEMVGMGLIDKRDVPLSDLTYVMRSLTGIAIALAINPKMIFLDETFAGMNPTEIMHAMNLVEKIRNHGMTVFLIEHNMKAIMGMCKRIMVLNMGSKIAEGTPEEICQNLEVIQAYLGKGFSNARTE